MREIPLEALNAEIIGFEPLPYSHELDLNKDNTSKYREDAMPKLTADQASVAAYMYTKKCRTINYIAAELETTQYQIKKALRDKGIQVIGGRKGLLMEEVEKIMELYNKGLTIAEIARKTKHRHETVKKYIARETADENFNSKTGKLK